MMIYTLVFLFGFLQSHKMCVIILFLSGNKYSNKALKQVLLLLHIQALKTPLFPI